MLLAGRSRNINSRWRSFSELSSILIAPQHMFIEVYSSDNLLVRKNYFVSNIMKNENAIILQCVLQDSFETDVTRVLLFKASLA